jgi:hypothetical protein
VGSELLPTVISVLRAIAALLLCLMQLELYRNSLIEPATADRD